MIWKIVQKIFPLFEWYPLILTPNLVSHISKDDFPDKVFSCLVNLIRCTQVKLLQSSTMTWAPQIRALVILPKNCGTNPGWYYCSWSTEIPATGLLSVSFLMNPNLFPFVIHSLLLAVTKVHDAQGCKSYFKPRNIYVRTTSFSSLNMDLGWRWDNFSCQDLNSCCKGDSTYVNMIFSICSCVRLFDLFI